MDDGNYPGDRSTIDSIYVKKPWLKSQDTIRYADIERCLKTPKVTGECGPFIIPAKDRKKLEKQWAKEDRITKKFIKWCDTIYQDFDSTYARYMTNPHPLLQDSLANDIFLKNLKIIQPICDSLHQKISKWKSGKMTVWYYYCSISVLTITMDGTGHKMGKEEERWILNDNWAMIDESLEELK